MHLLCHLSPGKSLHSNRIGGGRQNSKHAGLQGTAGRVAEPVLSVAVRRIAEPGRDELAGLYGCIERGGNTFRPAAWMQFFQVPFMEEFLHSG